MKNQVQLITYVDRLARDLKGLKSLLHGPFATLFGGVHLLPFFTPIDGSDAGFDPIDHTEVDARLGDWNDIRALSKEVDIMADLIVNHISSASPQFNDFSRAGSHSQFAGMFLAYDRVFPKGGTEAELLRIYRPRPGLPFTNTTLQTGEKRLLWTTFTPQQIDIDVQHPEGERYLDTILHQFQSAGIRMIRLDAVGYAIKKAGTSCFMIPETFRFIGDLASKARTLGMEILVEIHSYYRQQIEIARQVDWIYDFALPPLVLHSLFVGNGRALGQWLQVRPHNCVTVLDTQRDVASQLKSWAASFASFSDQLRRSDPDLRSIFDNGIVASKQLQTLLVDNESALPTLLGNLITFNSIQQVRLPYVKAILQLLPPQIAGGFYVTPGDGTAHFGMVNQTPQDNPQSPCTNGYQSTKIRGNNGGGDWGGPANLDAYCHTDDANDQRGSRYVPRPAGDTANVTNSDPYPGPVYGKSSHPTVGEQNSGKTFSGSSSSSAAAAPAPTGVLNLPYDPSTGTVTGADGKSYQLGFNGPLAPIFGSNSWEWLLIAPTMR